MARTAEFSKRTKLDAFERAKGKCETCGVKIHSGAEYDHIIEETLTHDNSLANCRVNCAKCHAVKTKRNRPEIDKTRRIFEKRAGLRRTRPLAGSRNSPFKKLMSGEVVRR